MSVGERGFARIAFAGLATNIAIVLTGAAVRVTGSGLGCPTWPTCDGGRLIGPLAFHPAIEWGNRLFSLLVTLASIACVIAARRRVPYRRDLFWLSVGLAIGVVAQIVLGGMTVLLHLEPVAVMTHFALSMVIIVDGLVLWSRARVPPVVGVPIGRRPRRAVMWTWILTAIVIVLGTATTAAGPHSGGDEIRRLGRLELAVQIHGAAVVVLLAVAVWARLQVEGTPLSGISSLHLWLLFGQGAVGWLQYQLKVPAALVMLHVAGAVAVWVVTVWFVVRTAPGAARIARCTSSSARSKRPAHDPGSTTPVPS